MQSTHCSINWGKSFAFVTLVIVLALMVISLGLLTHSAAPNGVGVDWGSRAVPACPPDVKDCKIAVDWGNSFSPELLDEPPANAVAVDWGNSFSVPCKPGDPKCKPEFEEMSVDWGS